MKTKKKPLVKKFFPFPLFRIDALADYLTEMRKQGLMIESTPHYGILKFRPVKPRDDLRYVILTHFFGSPYQKTRDWDIEFMRKRFPQFDKEFHNEPAWYTWYTRPYYFDLYYSSSISDEDFEALKQFRRKRLKKINIKRILLYFLAATPFIIFALITLL